MELIKYELDNGMKVLLQRSASAPVVACNVWVGVGSADETPEEAGLAHVHEHMLFKGTENRQVGQVAREVESAGGHINAFTSFDQTCYYVVMSSRFFDTGLDILSDAVRNSSFDALELEKELEVIQEEIKRGKDNPSRVTSLKLFETAYSEHPYRLPVIGTKESVDSFEREDVLNFFNKHYTPGNIALVLVGDFEIDEAKALVEDKFGDWEGRPYDRTARDVEPEQSSFRGFTKSEDLEQAHLRVGFHIPNAVHDDIPALDLLGAIMGYGDASHLYQTIQREREMVNSISAGAYTPKDAGLFMISAQYQLGERGRSHDEIYNAIMREVYRFRHVRVSDMDLQRARTLIQSQEIYGKQTVQGLAMKMGHYQMVTGDPGYEQEYYAALGEVTPADIKRVAREYLQPANCTTVLTYPEGSGDIDADTLEELNEDALETASDEYVEARTEVDDEGFVRVELPDGPTLVVQEDHSVETFSIRAMTLGGLRYETPEVNGINSLLSELIIKGTERRDAVEISHEVESMAGSINGIGGRNSFGLSMSGLSEFFEKSFEIFADCLLSSTIPDLEFERDRRLQLQQIRSRRDSLAKSNYRQFSDAFYSPHPYGMPSDGTEESLSALTVDDARAYLKKLVRPENLTLVVVGDVDADFVLEMAERYLVHIDDREPFEPEIPEFHEHKEPKLVMGDLDKEQAHIIVGFDTPPLSDERKYPLEVLYAILSGQGGRLFYELRDQQSLAYSVGARIIFGLDVSSFIITIGTSPEKIEQAMEGIVGEVNKLRDGTITADEVERAKRYLIGSHDIGLQKNSARSMTVALDELYGLGYRRSLKFGERIEAVTLDDVQACVNDYLDPSRMVVSITKPSEVEVAEDLLAQLG
ncbi:MAG: M16 family metallopeptidase [Myxococcota bacterium]